MRSSNVVFCTLYILASVLGFAGCENMELNPEKVSVESVTLNSTSMEIEVGQSQTLTATISPSDADNRKVIWSTSNSSVATVADGVVTGVSAGSVTITAKSDDGGKTAICEVTVKAVAATVGPATLEMNRITATTASFDGHLNVSENEIPFSAVTLYYSDEETFSIGTAQSVSLTTFGPDQNFSFYLTDLRFDTEYSYSLVVKVKSEETYLDVKKFTTNNISVKLEIDESSLTEWPAKMNGTVSGLSVEDKEAIEIGIVWSMASGGTQNEEAVKLHADEISEDGMFTLILSDWHNLKDYYYCSYVSQGGDCKYGQEEKCTVEFTHISSRLITIEEVGYDYYTIEIKVPEDVTAAGNHVHFSFGDIWNLKSACNGESVEDRLRELSISGTCSGCVDSEWIWQTKQNKRIKVNESLYEGAPSVKPGEPVYVAAGEITPDGELVGEPEVHFFRTIQPSQLDAEFKVEFEEITAADATIQVIPDDNIVKWYRMILSDDDYQRILVDLEDESYLQWFVTFNVDNVIWSAGSLTDSADIKLTDIYLPDEITPNTKYHLLLTGCGNELGTTQCFKHVEFETTSKKRTMAPVIEVTALPEESTSFSAAFRIKCTSWDNPASGPVVSGVSCVNYKHNWLYYDDYSRLLSQKGTEFTPEQIAAINSESGYVMNIPVIDGMELRCGVQGINDEYDSSGAVIVDYATPYYVADAVSSDFLSTDILEGEWIMTATDIDGKEIETTVDIIRCLKEGRDYQSGCASEFIEQVDVFNQKRLADKNSLLIQGWFLDSRYGEDGPYAFRSPYDLLMSRDYNAMTYEQLFFDFGPKIFMEVKSDGTLAIISDAHRYMPVEAWGAWLYLGGISPDRTAVMGNYSPNIPALEFPVTVSEDNKTLTIEPANYDGTKYYLNVLRMGYSGLEVDTLVNSPIVLKKK